MLRKSYGKYKYIYKVSPSKDYTVNHMEKPAVEKIVEIDGKKLKLWVPNFRLGKRKAIEAFTEWVQKKRTKKEIELEKEIMVLLRQEKNTKV